MDASAALDKETTSLAALTPPAALQPVQDAVVKGLQKVHAKLEALSGLIYEESATEAAQNGPIRDAGRQAAGAAHGAQHEARRGGRVGVAGPLRHASRACRPGRDGRARTQAAGARKRLRRLRA